VNFFCNVINQQQKLVLVIWFCGEKSCAYIVQLSCLLFLAFNVYKRLLFQIVIFFLLLNWLVYFNCHYIFAWVGTSKLDWQCACKEQK